MKTYIINEDLIALLKKEQQTIIYEVKRVRVVDSNYSKIIKNNCLFYGCSLEGRKKYVKKMLKIKYRVPIIINKKIILVPLESMRKSECLFINPAKIIDYCHNKII